MLTTNKFVAPDLATIYAMCQKPIRFPQRSEYGQRIKAPTRPLKNVQSQPVTHSIKSAQVPSNPSTCEVSPLPLAIVAKVPNTASSPSASPPEFSALTRK